MQSSRLYHFWVCLKAGKKKKKKIQFSNFTGEFDDKTMSLGHMGAQLVVMGVFENGIYPPTMALWYVY